MTEQISPMPERRLSREEILAMKNRRTLVTVFQISWIMVFVCLAVVAIQIRGTSGPLPALTAPQVIVPLLATVSIVASAWTAWRSLKAIQGGQRGAFTVYWRYTLVLGGAFLAVMLAVMAFNPYAGLLQYGQIFRVMIVYHAVHALVIGAWMVHVYRAAGRGAYGPDDHWSIEAGAKLWYFVVIAWVLFYAVLYVF
jgi:heme/copper-type cytochrome/quinol oxidase subunit 3